MIKYTPKDIARFWSKVKFPDCIGTDECWEWMPGINSKRRYGAFWHKTNNVAAHRASYEIAYATDIPNDLLACHKCDNVNCVNPQHIFIGTSQDNTDDMIQKGRYKSSQNLPRGSNTWCSKLKEEQIPIIRKMHRNGFSHRKLAAIFHVSNRTICDICRYRAWAHIP